MTKRQQQRRVRACVCVCVCVCVCLEPGLERNQPFGARPMLDARLQPSKSHSHVAVPSFPWQVASPAAAAASSGSARADMMDELLQSARPSNHQQFQQQRGRTRVGPADDDDEVVEVDPGRRFHRYKEQVGEGRFKKVFRGYDTEEGVDVAWSKVYAEENGVDAAQAEGIIDEMRKGLHLEHPNIIRCYSCWVDSRRRCINLITELFTSGNLRDYRQHYRHLDQKALKKMGRQILNGLAYLHGQQPPVVHGDLRCDKIYVNGFNGEVKIGDLGLQALLVKRYEGTAAPEELKTAPTDVYLFGLCMLELFTKGNVDRSQSFADSWRLLRKVKDHEVHDLIASCLVPPESRPTPLQLLACDFFSKPHASQDMQELPPSRRGASDPVGRRGPLHKGAGRLRGEDYIFVVHGSESHEEGKVHFEIVMTKEEDGTVRNVAFDYILQEDTPEKVADEMANSFGLSMTDKEICASALREWLASRDTPAHLHPTSGLHTSRR